jgi:hypothetical protein
MGGLLQNAKALLEAVQRIWNTLRAVVEPPIVARVTTGDQTHFIFA